MYQQTNRRKFVEHLALSTIAGALTLRCDNKSGGVDAPERVMGNGDGSTGDMDSHGGTSDSGDAGELPGSANGGESGVPGEYAGECSDVECQDGDPTCVQTGTDILGPKYRPGAPQRTVLAGPNEPGDRLLLTGRVWAPGCSVALAGALLDVWHADAQGDYDDTSSEFRLRGQLLTDSEGRFSIETIFPGHYESGGTRPRHVHVTVTHPAHKSLTTQFYFEGDPFLSPNDSCGVCNSEDPSLVLPVESALANGKLQHSAEAVVVLS